MADNVGYTPGSGALVAADEIGGILYQRVKPAFGVDGTATDVSSTDPLPVTLLASGAVIGHVILDSGTLTSITNAVSVTGTFWQATQPVSLASVPLPSGAATEATLSTLNGKVTAVNTGAVVVSSSALPSGAATSAKQPALGTAGTASTDVITVQGIASMTALKVDGSAVTQPVSGTVAATQSGSWSLAANQSTNVAQVGGTATDTNSGTKSAGTIRVVLATDQPQLTNKLLVTPDANSAVNVAQINGVTTTMGNGVSGTGVQRVTLASDSTGQVTLAAGAATIGALTANQSVNVAQINGVTTTTGNGVSGTGVQRVTLASDSTGQVALAASSAVIGHVIVDSGTVTTVSTVTSLTQFGGTNIVTGGAAGLLGVGGPNATNVAITGNPVNSGAQAVSSENAVVTTGRMVQLVADLVGKQIVLPYANPENFVNGTTAAITDTTSTAIIAASGSASIRNYVTSVLVTNSHATVGTFVKILEGANIICEGYAAAAGGGFSATFPTPLRGAGNTAINAQPVTTGANVIASASGYKGV